MDFAVAHSSAGDRRANNNKGEETAREKGEMANVCLEALVCVPQKKMLSRQKTTRVVFHDELCCPLLVCCLLRGGHVETNEFFESISAVLPSACCKLLATKSTIESTLALSIIYLVTYEVTSFTLVLGSALRQYTRYGRNAWLEMKRTSLFSLHFFFISVFNGSIVPLGVCQPVHLLSPRSKGILCRY